MPDSVSKNNKRIAKNTILLSLRMVITLLVMLYTTRVVLAGLGVTDYGIYNIVCGFVSMFAFLSVAMSNGIQRFYNFELSRNGITGARKVYNAALVIQVLLTLILFLLSVTIGTWYIQNKMVIAAESMETALYIFYMSVISFAFVILQVPFIAAIMAHERMDYYALVTVLDAFLKLGIALSLSWIADDRLLFYGFLMMLIPVFDFLLYAIYAKKKFKLEIVYSKHIDTHLLRSMLTFSSWNIVGIFGDILRDQGVNILLNLFFGVVVNAARGVTAQIIAGLQGLVNNIGVAIRPQIVQSYAQNDIKRTLSLMYSLSRLSFLFLYVISLPVIVETDWILEIWLGDNVPEYTAIFFRLVIIVTYINVLNSAVSAVVHATGNMKLYQLTGTLATISVLPVSYVWLLQGGSPISPYCICIFFAIIMQIVALWVLGKIITFSIKDYLIQVGKPITIIALVTFALPFIPHFLLSEGIVRFIVVSATAVLFAGGGSYFYGFNEAEKNIIKSFIVRKTSRFRK